MKAIRIHEHGGPEVLKFEDVEKPAIQSGHVLVRVQSIGVNFIDTYQRTGLYSVTLPLTLGQEGAGIIEEVAEDVQWFRKGERVAWTNVPGAYAEFAAVPASRLVKVTEDISFEIAASAMLQGMTAHYLTTSTYPLQHGDTCLVYAAAGGVGLMLTQIAKLRGATVIGTTSSKDKADLARHAGADHVIRYDTHSVADEVRRITGGRGVDVVYDSVGKTSWEWSLNSLRPRGMLVSFGNSSGPVGNIDPLVLSRQGSLFLTRPTLAHYTVTRQELDWRAHDLFNWIREGKLDVRIDRKLPLANAADAHRALESRATAGKVLLNP